MLFLPLWQIGRNRSLDMEIESQRKKMLALEEEERVIKANIATLSNESLAYLLESDIDYDTLLLSSL